MLLGKGEGMKEMIESIVVEFVNHLVRWIDYFQQLSHDLSFKLSEIFGVEG